MEAKTFRPATFVAFIDTRVFTPETVRVNPTTTGLQYGIRAEDGTWFNLWDNRPQVRAAFYTVRKCSNQLSVAEMVKETSRCKSNILACNQATLAYRSAAQEWLKAIGQEAFVRILENWDTGYLYGTLDTPNSDSAAWATFHIDGNMPEKTMWSTKIDNVCLYFLPLKKVEQNATMPVEHTVIDLPGHVVATADKPEEGDRNNGDGKDDDGVEILEVGPVSDLNDEAIQVAKFEQQLASCGLPAAA